MNNITQLRMDTATFDDFWAVVWIKKDKGQCRRIFQMITRPGGWDTWDAIKIGGQVMDRIPLHLEATPEEIIEGAKRYGRSVVTKNYRISEYAKWPKTWLMAGGWENDDG